MPINQNSPRRPRREPRAYERLWNDRCVDKDLKDEWLSALNTFKTIDTISICQGHLNERSNRIRSANINIRVKSQFTDSTRQIFDAPAIAMQTVNLPDDTHWEYSYEERISDRRPRMMNNIVYRFSRLNEHHTDEMDVAKTLWFEKMVESISTLDNLFSEALEEEKRRHG